MGLYDSGWKSCNIETDGNEDENEEGREGGREGKVVASSFAGAITTTI